MTPSAAPGTDDKRAKAAAAKARKEARREIRRRLAAEAGAAARDLGLPPGAIDVGASRSNACRPLPAPPPLLPADARTTVCLFYQYREPAWTAREHRAALTQVTALATRHGVTGRGRCAPEGLNCTLTASANDMRAFCYGLRAWDGAMFDSTDFKLEDGVPNHARFRTFTLRKVDELVGYALEGVKAPSLQRHAGDHLEAIDYHKQMQRKDTVIIDVRNAYETDIGHFQPPEGGAQLLDPKMRTSQDFPKWLNAPETKEKLKDKTVMMYCTGGIRCERATALLNQITDAEPDFDTKGVVMVRGGIERYLKTFPEGGYWKGKNYLFDKRMEQVPARKASEALASDVESCCCLCQAPCAQYRGQHKCARTLPASGLPCAVPVIVCEADRCQRAAADRPLALACPLCVEGHQTPETAPDLVGQKRQLGLIARGGVDVVTGRRVTGATTPVAASRRLFVGKLPLSMSATRLRAAFDRGGSAVESVHWIVDRRSGAFYGSAFCYMVSVEDAMKAQALGRLCVPGAFKRRGAGRGRKKQPWMARVAFAPLRTDEAWPPTPFHQSEHPPLGCGEPTSPCPLGSCPKAPSELTPLA